MTQANAHMKFTSTKWASLDLPSFGWVYLITITDGARWICLKSQAYCWKMSPDISGQFWTVGLRHAHEDMPTYK